MRLVALALILAPIAGCAAPFGFDETGAAQLFAASGPGSCAGTQAEMEPCSTDCDCGCGLFCIKKGTYAGTCGYSPAPDCMAPACLADPPAFCKP